MVTMPPEVVRMRASSTVFVKASSLVNRDLGAMSDGRPGRSAEYLAAAVSEAQSLLLNARRGRSSLRRWGFRCGKERRGRSVLHRERERERSQWGLTIEATACQLSGRQSNGCKSRLEKESEMGVVEAGRRTRLISSPALSLCVCLSLVSAACT